MELNDYDFHAKKYFLNLTKFPTQASPDGITEESLKKFLPCAKYIENTLKEIGLSVVELTEHGYVYAKIPSNIEHKTHNIAVMAHYDTALENADRPVVALEHTYEKGDIKLPNNNIIIKEEELKGKSGQTIITGDGIAQLGVDDKVGVAEILDFARFIINNPDIKHGNISLIFNNNEEVGRGIEYLDYKKLDADYAYCVDGGDIGNLFIENFNAEACDIEVTGVAVHPGYAKGQMVNALSIINEMVHNLGSKFKSPEQSEKREPYLGLNAIEGNWTKAKAHYILRGFDKKDIQEMSNAIETQAKNLIGEYPTATIDITWDNIHKYENAGEILKKHPLVNQLAEKAYEACGISVVQDLTRGGFDGVKMSFAGLPTTNLFDGGMNFHGLNEWVSVEDMELTVKMLVQLAVLWGQQESASN